MIRIRFFRLSLSDVLLSGGCNQVHGYIVDILYAEWTAEKIYKPKYKINYG